MGTTSRTNAMTQELKSERVQEPEAVVNRKRVVRPDDQGGAVSMTRSQMEERLKSERVQSRLRRMPGWRMQKGRKSIDRVREFPDEMSAVLFLAFSAVLAREAKLPLQVLMRGTTLTIALPGSSRNAGIVNEDVLNLAELLG